MTNFSDELRKILMAGVGAISVAAEKVPETLETLSKRGEEAMEHGKVLNEQLRHEIKQAVKENVTVVEAPPDKDAVMNALDGMTPDELKAIKEKLAKMEQQSDDEQSK